MVQYLVIAAKSISVYLFIILAIRIFGRKELSQLSVIDLVFILLISNSVQNAMVGPDTSLLGGFSAALGLFLCNYMFRHVLRKYKRFNRLIQGSPILLVAEGKIIERGLKLARMSEDELEMAIREHGVNKLDQVDSAILEVDGNISIISHDYTKNSNKRRKKVQTEHNP